MSTKSDILLILEGSRGRCVSGQELAEKLELSRTAVWKAIKALKMEGHKIHAVTNKGYRLDSSSDVLSAESIACCLPENMSGLPIIVCKTVDSTNTQLKKLALDGAVHGTVLVSEEQTAGRGRSGKSFFSPRGTGLYLSILLRPQAGGGDPQLITVGAAVAVCEAIEQLTGLEVQIKWVNDIFLDGKKICGILTEAATDFESGGIESIVVGVGINCSTRGDAFPEELREVAGSLGVKGISRSCLAAKIIQGIIDSFESKTDEKRLIGEYRKRSFLIGKTVSFLKDGSLICATVTEIGDTGCLLVNCDNGETLALNSGEISVGRI